MLILWEGSVCGWAEAIDRIRRDPGLLYATREEAVREGLARLRPAHALGLLEPMA